MPMTEKQYVLTCSYCGKYVQFFSMEAVKSYGDICPRCYSRLRLRVISGVPDPKTGFVTVGVTDCYGSTVTPKPLDK